MAYFTRDGEGNQHTFENGQKDYNVEYVQKALIKGGFTDADGNELDPDGEWGTKSQAAYDKYLKNFKILYQYLCKYLSIGIIRLAIEIS